MPMYEQMVYSIFIFRPHALYAAAAFVLCMVYIGVDALHVTPTGQREDHAFVGDHIFDGEIRRIGYNRVRRSSRISSSHRGVPSLRFP